MSPPVNLDGNTVDAITIDGESVGQVTVDGSTVFGAIPDSMDIAKLSHYYSAQNVNGKDGDAVSTLTDLKNGDDLTAGVAPILKTGIINGKPIVRFDGADNYLDGVFSSSISAPYHITLVFQFRDAQGAAFDGFNNQVNFQYDGNASWRINSGGQSLFGGTTDLNAHDSLLDYDASDSEIIISDSSVAAGSVNNTVLDGLTMGSYNDQTFNAAIDIAELSVFSDTLTNTEKSDIQTYYASEYGV